MAFIHDDFLLTTGAAKRLYHEIASRQPILDYHNHLPAKDIAENRQFGDLFEIWLEGDHYKWRAMRSNGIPERLCTGEASHRDKFAAWAETVPHTLRNPLYHWTHLELKRYFGIDALLDPSTASHVWARANELLGTPDLRVQSILRKFDVRALCTTDDPTDDLRYHRALASSEFSVKVRPTFRPDRALTVDRPAVFNAWIERLGAAGDIEVKDFASFLEALEARHGFFHEMGCRLSDHGLSHCYARECGESEAADIFDKARKGQPASPVEHEKFAALLMLLFGRLDAAKGWTKQLHLGAMRNNNTRLFQQVGPDAGFDSIGDWPQAQPLAAYLDGLDRENHLPKTILYNLNPADNYLFGSMVGNFQGGTIPGKVQFGGGWWFLDQREGMEWQLNALSNLGLLSRFIGMLTDSRSFMSFPRHEYFRRTLCNLIGRDVENGEIPDEPALLETLVGDVCYRNAARYLGL